MKKLVFLLAAFVISLGAMAQEAFVIHNYTVDVNINANGSFDVKESIALSFSESRHGIVRKIPFRYKQTRVDTANRAKRGDYSPYYETYVKNISVEGFEFSTTKEGDFIVIKIGNANNYVSGNQTYVVKYTVWGALNKFSRTTEFFWNMVGNDWDTKIENVAFHVRFPSKIKLGNSDVLAFTGREGSKESNVTMDISPEGISGRSTKILNANEGITLAVRFPLSYFKSTDIPIEEMANQFYVKTYNTIVKLNKDASLNVTERYVVTFVNPTYAFTRYFGNTQSEEENATKSRENIFIENFTGACVSGAEKKLRFTSQAFGDSKNIKVEASGAMTGTYEFVFNYRVWGAYSFKENLAEINWNMLNSDMKEPVESFAFKLIIDTTIHYTRQHIGFFENKSPVFYDVHCDYKENSYAPKLNITAKNCPQIDFKVKLHGSNISQKMVPYDIYAKNYVIKDFNTELTVQKNGVVHVKQIYKIAFANNKDANNNFYTEIRYVYPKDWRMYTTRRYEVPYYALLGNKTKLIVKNIDAEPSPNIRTDWQDMNYIVDFNSTAAKKDSIYTIEYDIFDIIHTKAGNFAMSYPLISLMDEPICSASFSIKFSEETAFPFLFYSISTDDEVAKNQTITIRRVGNTIIGTLPRGLMPQQSAILYAEFPRSYLSVGTLWLKIQLLWMNNFLLIIPFLFLILLLIIWYFIGRDTKETVVVSYYPPAEVTPAEVGLLWDNKLQKRDLVALIFYWAGYGYLTIKEFTNPLTHETDYELTKLMNLPPFAKNYELTMFLRLFKSGDTVKISSLKNSYYITMNTAERELLADAKNRNFYKPGTIAFGRFLMLLSILALILGTVMAMKYDLNFWEVVICFTSIFAMLRVFGHIMPKRGPYGAKVHAQAHGFYEFIKRAELPRLSEILKENPQYFYQTLSYAIVMGQGKEWAGKFDTLVTESPSWFVSDKTTNFNTLLFANLVISSMHQINSNMNYAHIATNSTSRSGWNSGGSSFSSWGGSGGSGFSGGGFSGGGFGGGGGSSW